MLVEKISSSDPLVIAEASVALRKALSQDRNPPIAEVLATGILPRLRELLSDFTRPSVQLETCWSLTNIASGTPDQTKAVVDCGVVPIFVELLKCSNPPLQEQALWALANIAGDRAEYRDGCISVGTVEALATIMDTSLRNRSTQMSRLAAWGLSNLCRGRPQPVFNKLQPCLPPLARALSLSNDSEVLADSAWALSYLTDTTDGSTMKTIVSQFDVKRIVSLLGHPSSSVHIPVLRAVGNLVAGQSEITRLVVEAGALNLFKSLVSSNKKSVRKETLWAVSNVCADSDTLVRSVIDCGLMDRICDIVRDGHADQDVRKEAVWSICNACTVGKQVDVASLVTDRRYRILDLLCEYLDACRDTQSMKTVLDSIYAILSIYENDPDGLNPFCVVVEECGGLATIEALQQDESADVYNAAVRILESFFDCNEDIVSPGPLNFDFGRPAQTKREGMPILPFARSG